MVPWRQRVLVMASVLPLARVVRELLAARPEQWPVGRLVARRTMIQLVAWHQVHLGAPTQR